MNETKLKMNISSAIDEFLRIILNKNYEISELKGNISDLCSQITMTYNLLQIIKRQNLSAITCQSSASLQQLQSDKEIQNGSERRKRN